MTADGDALAGSLTYARLGCAVPAPRLGVTALDALGAQPSSVEVMRRGSATLLLPATAWASTAGGERDR